MNYFPYRTVRGGQSEFLEDCRHAFSKGGLLVAHAPTGIGKTAAALSAALEEAVASHKTVFFLTPKHTQHTIAVETVKQIVERHGVNVVLADFIGKQWMCPQGVRDLTSREFNEFCRAQKKDELCEYHKNTKTSKMTKRALGAVAKVSCRPMHNEEVRAECALGKLCPYEVLLEAGRKADVIVCDYFHIFSGSVRKAFLNKLGKTLGESILVVDEAHNLPERVRGIASTRLSTYSLEKAVKEASALNARQTGEELKGVLKALKAFGRGVKPGGERYVEKTDFMEAVKSAACEDYEDVVIDAESLGSEVLKLPGRYRSFAAAAARFLIDWRGPEIGYTRILERDEKGSTLSYRCLDPSVSCAEVFAEARAGVLMSGTLTPLTMYSEVLGVNRERAMERSYVSPFPSENRMILVVPGLTTKYQARSDHMYMKYASTITSLAAAVPGNVAVFYPSYRLLHAIGSKVASGKEMVFERQEMGKEERFKMHSRIASSGGKGCILMAVQAGGFSEGLDFPDNMLDAVIVVGLPLERPNLETHAMIDYYDFKFGRGWDYGYIYPAVNRALQASGRCIRSETDRGAIILLDERFKWGNYRKCFPSDFNFTVTEDPSAHLRRFFSGALSRR